MSTSEPSCHLKIVGQVSLSRLDTTTNCVPKGFHGLDGLCFLKGWVAFIYVSLDVPIDQIPAICCRDANSEREDMSPRKLSP